MNDGNDKHEGAWWGNLETLKPSQVQSDYSYVDEDDRRKKFIIIAAVIGIVLVLLLGGVTAFTVLSSNKGHDSDTKKEQTQTQKKETSTENAKKKKSAEKSAISVMVTADGAAEDSKASVSVSEKGKNGKIVVKDISVAVNDEVKICTLPKGKYLLTVESAPDGYDKPAKSTSFTVKGDGKKVSAFAFLAKHVDKTAKSGESEDNAEATPADGASQNQDASSDGQNQNNQAENSSADAVYRNSSHPAEDRSQRPEEPVFFHHEAGFTANSPHKQFTDKQIPIGGMRSCTNNIFVIIGNGDFGLPSQQFVVDKTTNSFLHSLNPCYAFDAFSISSATIFISLSRSSCNLL